MSDILPEVDSLPTRKPIDDSINQHGRELIDFLLDARFCVLNSRFDNDQYTSISPKGKSVVDYLCVPHDIFDKCTFNVLTMQSIIDEHNLHELLGQRSSPPDHSVLVTSLSLNPDTNLNREQNDTTYAHHTPRVKYKLNKIPVNFMDRELARLALLQVIDKIENTRETQQSIDNIYENLCDTILNEMNHSIPKYNVSNRTKKRNKNAKPYWNDALTEKWNMMRISENNFLKCNGPRHLKTQKRNDFLKARQSFNKLLRQTEREYRRYVAIDIETTGLDPRKDAIIEVAAIGFQDDEIIDQFSTLVNPHQEISEFITQLTGITREMVEHQPSIFTVRSKLKRIIGDRVVVGHDVLDVIGHIVHRVLGVDGVGHGFIHGVELVLFAVDGLDYVLHRIGGDDVDVDVLLLSESVGAPDGLI